MSRNAQPVDVKKFHGECELVERRPRGDYYCKLHKVEFCHCGWEWGWHYGTETALIEWKFHEKKAVQRTSENL